MGPVFANSINNFSEKILYICKIAKQDIDIEIVLENRSGFPTFGKC